MYINLTRYSLLESNEKTTFQLEPERIGMIERGRGGKQCVIRAEKVSPYSHKTWDESPYRPGYQKR